MTETYAKIGGPTIPIGQGGVEVQAFTDTADAIEPFPYRSNVMRVGRTVATPISFIVPPPSHLAIGSCFFVLEDDGVVAITLLPGVGDITTTLNGVNGPHVLGVIATKRITFIYTHEVNYKILSIAVP